MRKPLKLVIDGPALARWLTSNPQHQNPADCVAVICHANGPLALPWPKISDDHKDDAHKKPKADPLYRALRDDTQAAAAAQADHRLLTQGPGPKRGAPNEIAENNI